MYLQDDGTTVTYRLQATAFSTYGSAIAIFTDREIIATTHPAQAQAG